MTQNPDDINTEIQALTSRHNHTTADDATSIVSSVFDMEKRPKSQLYAVIVILLLYVLFFACGALTVALPFTDYIPYEEIIFSYMYGVSSSAFGIFMIVYFCLTRKDSCTSWRRFFQCEQHPVYDMNYQNTTAQSNLSNGHVIRAVNDLDLDNKPYNISQDLTDGSIKQSNIMNSQGFLNDTHSSVSGPADINTSAYFNTKQNGVAKKFWEKKQRHHSKLITREMQKEYNGSDYLSGSEVNHKLKGSEADTQFSIDIQMQPNGAPKGVGNPGTVSPIVTLQSALFPNPLVLPTISTSYGPIPRFSMLPLDRNVIPPVGGSMSPDMGHMTGIVSGHVTSTSPCFNSMLYNDSQTHNPQVRSPSACSLGYKTHSSAFTPVSSQRNNTLPKQGRSYPVVSTPVTSQNNADFMARNGSNPRIRDFDGQSQISESGQRDPQHVEQINNLNNNQMYNKHATHHGNNINELNSRLSPTTRAFAYKQYGSVDDHIVPGLNAPISPVQSPVQPPQSVPYHFSRARSSSGGGSSEASVKVQGHRDQAFLQEVQQRIPSDNKPPVIPNGPSTDLRSPKSPTAYMKNMNGRHMLFSSMHDSDSQINMRRNRANDSDHNSEPTSHISHRRKHHHNDSHRHAKHQKHSAKNRYNWEEYSRLERPKHIPYAYVNHHYHDRVRQKLQKKAKSEGGMYPQLIEDDTPSTSDDDKELDDVWVMQNNSKDKKETSV